ncbi:hypothetical protein PGT21_020201 [Puccinia graminis f. sp. tritici]|uniref:Uncharacterized protein n=1 Tax=Puccinia graminis f. sp. tritici TaxID=56615 RepID=A0A5B0Q6A6_PUCGR|nr:hypothetical protein PGT21_020201 [Puccinia graminis f. sp. tritici]
MTDCQNLATTGTAHIDAASQFLDGLSEINEETGPVLSATGLESDTTVPLI